MLKAIIGLFIASCVMLLIMAGLGFWKLYEVMGLWMIAVLSVMIICSSVCVLLVIGFIKNLGSELTRFVNKIKSYIEDFKALPTKQKIKYLTALLKKVFSK